MLFEDFEAFIKEQQLLKIQDKILLAVSGGIDSMVMLHLFYRMGVNCSVAHCNFQLRDNESDIDEQFVRDQCKMLGFPVYVTRFETIGYAEENHLSIQMAARELRYNWFQRLVQSHGIEYVAVAHNKDDSLETFFINMLRGTGINGLTGIKPKHENIIRPLLFAFRIEISEYARANGILYREDSSNASDKYLRNQIRHHIFPAISQFVPNFKDTLQLTIGNIQETSILYSSYIQQLVNELVTKEEDHFKIDIFKLHLTTSPKTVLYEILKHFRFSSVMVKEILQSANAISGKQFFSPTHQLIKDRNSYIIIALHAEKPAIYYLEKDIQKMEQPLPLTMDILNMPEQLAIQKSLDVAFLDYNKLDFPLFIRKWHAGDYFVPLGMKGMKKVSDFFIDQKYSLLEKENTWILFSGNQIVWIIGKRIDDRYKITPDTRIIYRLTIKKPTKEVG